MPRDHFPWVCHTRKVVYDVKHDVKEKKNSRFPWGFRKLRAQLIGQMRHQHRHPRNLMMIAGSGHSRPRMEDKSCRTAVGLLLCRRSSPLKVQTGALQLDSML